MPCWIFGPTGGAVGASVTRPWCQYWHLIKLIKNSCILAHDATLWSQITWWTSGPRKITPAGRSWEEGQLKDQPPTLSFLSPWSVPSFFMAAQMGSYFLFPVVWMGCLETAGNCPKGRDFLTVGWKVMGSANGWYVYYIHIVIHQLHSDLLFV